MKRSRSVSSDSECTGEGGPQAGWALEEGAELLLGLRHAAWDSEPESTTATDDEARRDSGRSASSQRGPGTLKAPPRPPPAKAARSSSGLAAPRSYVWRGPHRLSAALKKLDRGAAADAAAHLLDDGGSSAAAATATGSPRCEPLAGSASDEDEGAELGSGHCGGGGAKQRDKEWAALTTWLRMNLHHPRTLKKLVLFVGEQERPGGRWTFDLNPGLSWDDVSIETKLRLQMLPKETETAFAHKYPERPRGEWMLKSQKYKPPGGAATATVPLGDMVTSLSAIYFRFEGGGGGCADDKQAAGNTDDALPDGSGSDGPEAAALQKEGGRQQPEAAYACTGLSQQQALAADTTERKPTAQQELQQAGLPAELPVLQAPRCVQSAAMACAGAPAAGVPAPGLPAQWPVLLPEHEAVLHHHQQLLAAMQAQAQRLQQQLREAVSTAGCQHMPPPALPLAPMGMPALPLPMLPLGPPPVIPSLPPVPAAVVLQQAHRAAVVAAASVAGMPAATPTSVRSLQPAGAATAAAAGSTSAKRVRGTSEDGSESCTEAMSPHTAPTLVAAC